MDTICLASSAWIKQRGNSVALISRVAAADRAQPVCLHLDAASVARDGAAAAPPRRPLHEVAFGLWVRDGVTEDGVLDIEKIRLAPYDFPADGIVVVNAAGFKSDIVVDALAQARKAFYPMTEWPAVFVLVVDDAQMFQISAILSNTFQLQPALQVPSAIKRSVGQFMQHARLLRIFGRRVGSAAKALRWFYDKGQKRRDKRENRGLGWTWEE